MADKLIEQINFGEFAALGSVIILLFIMLFWVIRSAHKERQETRESHRQERKEWNVEATNRASRNDEVVDKLADAIKGM